MRRFIVSVVGCALLCGVTVSGFAEEPHELWLRLCVGQFKATSSTGVTFDVVGKPLLNGKAVMFEATTSDGARSVGILGWEPDKKRLMETGYGSAGDYYQFIYSKVTSEELKGQYLERTAQGEILQGDWHVWREGEHVLLWEFEGTKDGEPHRFDGKHERVK